MIEAGLPKSADGFTPAGDFDAVREPLFELIGQLCLDQAEVAEDEAATVDSLDAVAVFPSDLDGLEELSPAERAELYDNLVFNQLPRPRGNRPVGRVLRGTRPMPPTSGSTSTSGRSGRRSGGGCVTRSPASTPKRWPSTRRSSPTSG